MASAPYGTLSETELLVSRQFSKPNVIAPELTVLVACGAPPSRYTNLTEASVLVSTQEAKVMVQVTDIVVLVSYIEGGTERFNSRAWGFDLDQHQFYVLHLGVEGTFVYDLLSQQWGQWITQGFDTWNAENGVEWNSEIYVGDNTLPVLWKLDVDAFLDDDFRPIKRVVTGGIPATARETLRSGMLVLSATKQSDVDEDAYVQLSISDDGGFTYKDRDALAVDDSETQDFSWRGLGTIRAPGRVFKIIDEGAVVTIDGADQQIAGEKSSG